MGGSGLDDVEMLARQVQARQEEEDGEAPNEGLPTSTQIQFRARRDLSTEKEAVEITFPRDVYRHWVESALVLKGGKVLQIIWKSPEEGGPKRNAEEEETKYELPAGMRIDERTDKLRDVPPKGAKKLVHSLDNYWNLTDVCYRFTLPILSREN